MAYNDEIYGGATKPDRSAILRGNPDPNKAPNARDFIDFQAAQRANLGSHLGDGGYDDFYAAPAEPDNAPSDLEPIQRDTTPITMASLQAAHDKWPDTYPAPQAYIDQIALTLTRRGYDIDTLGFDGAVAEYQREQEAKGIKTGSGLTNGLVDQLTLDVKHDEIQASVATVIAIQREADAADVAAAVAAAAAEPVGVSYDDAIDGLKTEYLNSIASITGVGNNDGKITAEEKQDIKDFLENNANAAQIGQITSVLAGNGISFTPDSAPAGPNQTPIDPALLAAFESKSLGG